MNQITLPLDIKSLQVVSQRIDTEGNIVFEVKSKTDHSTCHKCGKPATKPNGRAPIRRIRHLPIFDQPVYLEIVALLRICRNYSCVNFEPLEIEKQALKNSFNSREPVASSFGYFYFIIHSFNKTAVLSLFKVIDDVRLVLTQR